MRRTRKDNSKTTMNRIRGLRSLIKEGLLMGFGISLIDDYKNQLATQKQKAQQERRNKFVSR